MSQHRPDWPDSVLLRLASREGLFSVAAASAAWALPQRCGLGCHALFVTMKSKGLAHPGQALQAGILNQHAFKTKGSYLICILQWRWGGQGLDVSRVVNE